MTLLRVLRGHRWRTVAGVAEAPDHGYLAIGDDGQRVFLPADLPIVVGRAVLAATCPSCCLVGCDLDHPRECFCACGRDHRAVSVCPHSHGLHPAGESRICGCNCKSCQPAFTLMS